MAPSKGWGRSLRCREGRGRGWVGVCGCGWLSLSLWCCLGSEVLRYRAGRQPRGGIVVVMHRLRRGICPEPPHTKPTTTRTVRSYYVPSTVHPDLLYDMHRQQESQPPCLADRCTLTSTAHEQRLAQQPPRVDPNNPSSIPCGLLRGTVEGPSSCSGRATVVTVGT